MTHAPMSRERMAQLSWQLPLYGLAGSFASMFASVELAVLGLAGSVVLAAIGLVLAIKGLRSQHRGSAIAGLALNAVIVVGTVLVMVAVTSGFATMNLAR